MTPTPFIDATQVAALRLLTQFRLSLTRRRPGRPLKYPKPQNLLQSPLREARQKAQGVPRTCLRCSAAFVAKDKFTRFCGEHCRRDAGSMAI